MASTEPLLHLAKLSLNIYALGLSQTASHLFTMQQSKILTRSIRIALFAPLALATVAFADTLPKIKTDSAPLVRNEQNSFAPIVEKVAPSVVTISINKQMRVGNRGDFQSPLGRLFGLPAPEDDSKKADTKGARKKLMPVGMGSGVIVSADGYILTNNHIVEAGDELVVTLADGKTEYKAKKIGNDPGSDIAVIKVDASGLKPITFADSDLIKVGDVALAIGNPFALRQSVTKGIISAVGRNETHISDFGNFIQTDAAINPGNSGGALVDTEGRLVGINTAIFSQSGGSMGIGFAVPGNQARSAMESLIQYGKVQRGFLGIGMQPLDDQLARDFKVPNKDGVLVTKVVDGGGAKKGGIKASDVITELNGQKVASLEEFRNTIAGMAPGVKVDLTIYRDGQEKKLAVILAERSAEGGILNVTPPPAAVKVPDVLDGVTVSDLTPEARKQFRIGDEVQGALITQVNPESPSAEAEIRPGDVVVEIAGKPVKNSEDAIKLSEEVKMNSSVRLLVNRKGTDRFVVVVERKDN